ncbi:unnamed protein product, partial [Brenthis ino]
MEASMNNSPSVTDLYEMGMSTPPSYVFQRTKRSIDGIDDSIIKQLEEFKEEIRKMLCHYSEKQEKEMQYMTTTLKEIQQSNISIENSIAYLTAQNQELKAKVYQLENQSKEEKKYIKLLEDKIETIQMSNQKRNFVIKNVPKRTNETKEDLIEMTLCLAKNIDCPITKHDIKDIYRAHGKLNTPIIVETGSTLIQKEVIKMGNTYDALRCNLFPLTCLPDNVCTLLLDVQNENIPAHINCNTFKFTE